MMDYQTHREQQHAECHQRVIECREAYEAAKAEGGRPLKRAAKALVAALVERKRWELSNDGTLGMCAACDGEVGKLGLGVEYKGPTTWLTCCCDDGCANAVTQIVKDSGYDPIEAYHKRELRNARRRGISMEAPLATGGTP